MRRIRMSAITGAVLVLVLGSTATSVAGAPSGQGCVHAPADYPWYTGAPEFVLQDSRAAAAVLDVINTASKRERLAEDWLRFSQRSIEKSHQLRQEWLSIQAQLLRRQEQAERLQLEMLRLQMEIENLRAQNLRLEKENLQLRLQLAKQPDTAAPTEPNKSSTSPAN